MTLFAAMRQQTGELHFKCFDLLVLEEAARRRGSCVELLEGDSPKQAEGENKETSEGGNPKQTEDQAAKVAMAETGRRGSAFGEKEEGKEASQDGNKEASQEGKDKLGNIPKLQRQRTRTRTISTSVYQDTEGRCGKAVYTLNIV